MWSNEVLFCREHENSRVLLGCPNCDEEYCVICLTHKVKSKFERLISDEYEKIRKALDLFDELSNDLEKVEPIILKNFLEVKSDLSQYYINMLFPPQTKYLTPEQILFRKKVASQNVKKLSRQVRVIDEEVIGKKNIFKKLKSSLHLRISRLAAYMHEMDRFSERQEFTRLYYKKQKCILETANILKFMRTGYYIAKNLKLDKISERIKATLYNILGNDAMKFQNPIPKPSGQQFVRQSSTSLEKLLQKKTSVDPNYLYYLKLNYGNFLYGFDPILRANEVINSTIEIPSELAQFSFIQTMDTILINGGMKKVEEKLEFMNQSYILQIPRTRKNWPNLKFIRTSEMLVKKYKHTLIELNLQFVFSLGGLGDQKQRYDEEEMVMCGYGAAKNIFRDYQKSYESLHENNPYTSPYMAKRASYPLHLLAAFEEKTLDAYLSLKNKEAHGLNHCEFFNLSDGKWYPFSNLTERKYSLSACSFQMKFIYVFGGIGAKDFNFKEKQIIPENLSKTIEAIDATLPRPNEWKKINLSTNFELLASSFCREINSEYILIFGGKDLSLNTSSNVYIFSAKKIFLQFAGTMKRNDHIMHGPPIRVGNEILGIGQDEGIHIFNINSNLWLHSTESDSEEWYRVSKGLLRLIDSEKNL